jgi:hypothetical protein
VLSRLELLVKQLERLSYTKIAKNTIDVSTENFWFRRVALVWHGTIKVVDVIGPTLLAAAHGLQVSLTSPKFDSGFFKVNLEFSFSFPGFSFSGLDLVFKSGFQT